MSTPSSTPSTRTINGPSKIYVGLGWKAPNDDFDLDASCVMLGADGKTRRQEDCVYFNNLSTANGEVIHRGDNLTGGNGQNDSEQIEIDLLRIPSDVEKLVFIVSIYEGEYKKGEYQKDSYTVKYDSQTFGAIEKSYVRVVDRLTDEEQLRFDLTQDAANDRTIIFSELFRKNGEWRFRALGEGYRGSLPELVQNRYGVLVDNDELRAHVKQTYNR